jgi:hypothetical protein
MLMSTIWVLAFESPMITIEKVIFGSGRKPQPKPQLPTTSKDIQPSAPPVESAPKTNVE